MNIDIIGAGIGGLTTAIALEQKGIKTTIFEQAEQIKPVGAGIILANNAMQVYEKLGLRKVIEEHGMIVSSMNITKPNLKPLSTIELSYFEKKYNTKNIAIHRGVLQEILMNHLKSPELKLNHKLSSLLANNKGYELNFENGKQFQTSMVVGADGLHSAVRTKVFPNNQLRNANQICWRGVTEYNLPIQFKHELNEAWGKSERFGFVQIAENKVYWYALKSFKSDKNEFSVNNIEHYFSDFHTVIKDLIQATPKEEIYTAEIIDLKPTHIWHNDYACLIGDAAHATTPNMGQGACQAIEDAYNLAACLHKHGNSKAFSEYQKLRLPKAHQIVKASWQVGKIAHLNNPLLIGLRNQILRFTPDFVSRKQNEQIFKLSELE
jgi:2-polyprenyl-6-methoxyphenol hydroxylase-like FAD-dependent oxidoreductase